MTRALQLPAWDDAPNVAVVTDTSSTAATATWQLVRQLYILCYRDFTGMFDYGTGPMPAWDGGEDGFGVRRRNVWLRIAQVILRHNASPLDFVRAQFYGKQNTRPPAPNQFLNDEAVTTWLNYCSARRQLDELAREYDNDRRSFFGTVMTYTSGPKWPEEKAVRYALANDTRVYATPLYRYCVAHKWGFDDFVDFYCERAMLQLLFRSEYAQVYGEFLPMTLRTAVTDLRSRIGLG